MGTQWAGTTAAPFGECLPPSGHGNHFPRSQRQHCLEPPFNRGRQPRLRKGKPKVPQQIGMGFRSPQPTGPPGEMPRKCSQKLTRVGQVDLLRGGPGSLWDPPDSEGQKQEHTAAGRAETKVAHGKGTARDRWGRGGVHSSSGSGTARRSGTREEPGRQSGGSAGNAGGREAGRLSGCCRENKRIDHYQAPDVPRLAVC